MNIFFLDKDPKIAAQLRGYSPIDALVEWLEYTPWKKKWGRKKKK